MELTLVRVHLPDSLCIFVFSCVRSHACSKNDYICGYVEYTGTRAQWCWKLSCNPGAHENHVPKGRGERLKGFEVLCNGTWEMLCLLAVSGFRGTLRALPRRTLSDSGHDCLVLPLKSSLRGKISHVFAMPHFDTALCRRLCCCNWHSFGSCWRASDLNFFFSSDWLLLPKKIAQVGEAIFVLKAAGENGADARGLRGCRGSFKQGALFFGACDVCLDNMLLR